MLVYLLVRGSACAHRRLVQTLCAGGRFEKMKRGLRGGSEKVLEGWLSVRMKEYEHERSDKVNLQTM